MVFLHQRLLLPLPRSQLAHGSLVPPGLPPLLQDLGGGRVSVSGLGRAEWGSCILLSMESVPSPRPVPSAAPVLSKCWVNFDFIKRRERPLLLDQAVLCVCARARA